MPFNPLMFRNVEGSPADPVATWPHEVFVAILSYGGLGDYRPVMREIFRDPWGEAAQSVEEILGYTDPEDEDEPIRPGTVALFREGLQQARKEMEEIERSAVAADLRAAVVRSQLTREQFARRCGTSASRLSTYTTGSVSPRASFVVRAHRVADEAAQ